MPKAKSHRGASKRFKARAGGSLKRKQAFKSHILNKKSTKRKRKLRKIIGVATADEKRVRKMTLN